MVKLYHLAAMGHELRPMVETCRCGGLRTRKCLVECGLHGEVGTASVVRHGGPVLLEGLPLGELLHGRALRS